MVRSIFAALFLMSTILCAVVAAQAPAQEPGYLGVICDDRNEAGKGIRAVEVVPEGPCAMAGMKKGDLIVAINRRPTPNMDAMGQIMTGTRAGDKLPFDVERGQEQLTLNVVLGQRPPQGQRKFEFGRIDQPGGSAPPAGSTAPGEATTVPGSTSPPGSTLPPGSSAPPGTLPNGAPGAIAPGGTTSPAARRAWLGVRTAPVGEYDRQRLGLQTAAGALITAVISGSPAERAGIPLGSVIVAANGQQIGNPLDLGRVIALVAPNTQVDIAFSYRGQLYTRQVALVEAPNVAYSPAGAAPGTLAPTQRPSLNGATNPGPAGRFTAPLRPQTVPGAGAVPNAAQTIDALQQRIRELERRIEELERAQGRTPTRP